MTNDGRNFHRRIKARHTRFTAAVPGLEPSKSEMRREIEAAMAASGVPIRRCEASRKTTKKRRK